MSDLIVTFNGTTITPTPLVSQSIQFMDLPIRFGNTNQIELKGVLTGITTPTDYSTLTNIFVGQFGNLVVSDTNNNIIYNWSNLYVDSIDLQSNHYFVGSFVPYTVKMRGFNVPSGVYEPVNELSFSQEDNGLVTLTHKVGAKGTKNSIGALDNAVSFVKTFTGINSFSPFFVKNGSGILVNQTESLDRAACTYSINQVFKYNTGFISSLYYSSLSTNISDVLEDEYLTIDVNLKLQGSPINNNLIQIESSLPSILGLLSSNFGINTGLLAQNTFSINRDSGAATIDIKSSFISGYSIQDVNGFFDYNVSLDYDAILPKENWKIDGEFSCKGPLTYKLQQLNVFKTLYGSDWRDYLIGLLISSPIYSGFHSGGNYLSSFSQMDIQENTGLAIFKAALNISDGSERGLPNPKYQVDVQPSRWNFELLPAANIEGHFIIQDPQMKTRGHVDITSSSDIENTGYINILNTSGVIRDLSGIYITSGVLEKQAIQSGLLNISYDSQWIAQDSMSPLMLSTKVVGSITNNFTRSEGFLFGY